MQLDAFPNKDNRAVRGDEAAERGGERLEFQSRSGADLVLVSEFAGPVEADQKFRR